MSKAAAFVSDRLLVLLLGAVVLGYLLPGAAGSAGGWVPVDLAVMIAALGLTVPLGDLAGGARELRQTALLAAAQMVLLPAAGWLLSRALPGPIPRAGLIATSLAPVEITSGIMAMLAGGDVALAVRVMASSLVASVVTIPLGLRLLLGMALPASPGAIMGELVLVLLLPFAAGSAVRQARPGLARWKPELAAVSSAAVVVLGFIVAAGVRADPIGDGWLPAGVACVLLLGCGYGLGWLLGRALRLPPGARATAILTGGMREFGIATAVALAFLPRGAAAVPALYGILMLICSTALARRLRRCSVHSAQ
ncbi:MAG: bile acid:sodium symporter family protein [Chloroflexota bacterium]